jgi:hypothetical protein
MSPDMPVSSAHIPTFYVLGVPSLVGKHTVRLCCFFSFRLSARRVSRTQEAPLRQKRPCSYTACFRRPKGPRGMPLQPLVRTCVWCLKHTKAAVDLEGLNYRTSIAVSVAVDDGSLQEVSLENAGFRGLTL